MIQNSFIISTGYETIVVADLGGSIKMSFIDYDGDGHTFEIVRKSAVMKELSEVLNRIYPKEV